ncbi:WxL protein peptidoglycan domain-containing protein [Phytohabitans suffuscus]|uniref:DUF916 domain-containing protein n=1 Tax=Phytohabitans suffuscus TaxID=624315 RepID=A0A6F8YFR5_9ACTN|nr:DUF916 domain-containing protein [Phytohabitans suffuscus]BCB84818.1 hypothetical protein Psuf_021310 [Phytohabitans suffuscus]
MARGRSTRRGTRLLARALAAAAGAALLVVPASAYAAPGGDVTWAVQPSTADGPDRRVSFRYELDPGAAVTDHVTVTNLSDGPATFRLYASDGVTTNAGVFDLLPGGEKPRDGGSWIRLAQSEVTLAAKARRIVPFTIAVPDDATPGDHPAGIVAAVGGSAPDGQVAVERRVGARVHLRVAGDLKPVLAPTDPDVDFTGGWGSDGTGTAHVAFDVENTGNVRLQGGAMVELSAPFGVWSRRFDVGAVPELLPGARFRVELTVEDVPALVVLTAKARVAPRAVGEDVVPVSLAGTDARGRSWAMPWFWTLVLLAAVAGVTLAVQTRGRWRRRLAVAVEQAREQGRRDARDTADAVDG